MTSIERVSLSLNHHEPDRVPIDFGGHLITGIHCDAYKNLLDYLGKDCSNIKIERYRQRTAVVDEEIFQMAHSDFRPLVPPMPDLKWSENESYREYTDEWGVSWKRNKNDGLYYEQNKACFEEMPSIDTLSEKVWPDYSLDKRITGLSEKAEEIFQKEKVPILDLPLGLEIFDAGFNICGSSNFYMLLALDPKAAEYIMDKQLEAQIDWWTQAIHSLPKLNFIRIGDDLGAQESMLVDPDMYRKMVLPRHKKLFREIKDVSEGRVKIIMHSDGAIEPVLGDLIDAGIDCLNPVQYTINGLDPKILKREFGKDLTFWGGGIDTQSILPSATPSEVKEEVKKQIDILAPGGGFVFSQVHIIQKDVPPGNIIAMFEAALEFGQY